MPGNNLSKIIDFGKKQAMKSPVNNQYCAILMFRNKIISHAYNTFKGPVHYNNLRQCILCS